jgi:WD40 repeat protein
VCTHVLNPDATGPIDGVTCVAIRPDASLVAAASIDRTVHLWRASDGHVIYRLVRCVHMRTSKCMHILLHVTMRYVQRVQVLMCAATHAVQRRVFQC